MKKFVPFAEFKNAGKDPKSKGKVAAGKDPKKPKPFKAGGVVRGAGAAAKGKSFSRTC